MPSLINQFGTTTCATTCKDATTCGGLHAVAKTVDFCLAAFFRLESTFHSIDYTRPIL